MLLVESSEVYISTGAVRSVIEMSIAYVSGCPATGSHRPCLPRFPQRASTGAPPSTPPFSSSSTSTTTTTSSTSLGAHLPSHLGCRHACSYPASP